MVAATTMDSVERVVVLECTGVTKVLSELWHVCIYGTGACCVCRVCTPQVLAVFVLCHV